MGGEWHGVMDVAVAWVSHCLVVCLLVFICVFVVIVVFVVYGAGSVLTERLVRAAAMHQQWHVQQFRVVLCKCIRCVARGAFAWRAFSAICISPVVVCCRQASQSRGSLCKSISMCNCACLIIACAAAIGPANR